MEINISDLYLVECPLKKKDFCDLLYRREKKEWKCGECVNSKTDELTGRILVYVNEILDLDFPNDEDKL